MKNSFRICFCRYWHVSGVGSAGQTQPNFNDFAPFCGFYNPIVKQYAQNMYLSACGSYLNYDVYKLSSKDAPQAQKTTDDKPIVGLLMDSLHE